MDSVFNRDFWIKHWKGDRQGDTYSVHKGFSTAQYWDKAALSYDQDTGEVKSRRLEKTLSFFREKHLFFEGMNVLDIGCGTGMLAIEMAKQGAKVTALDFSKGMLDKFREDIPLDMKGKITLLHKDWLAVDIEKKKWEKKFDLVMAFMSPGVSTPEAFFKMMACSKNGCAMRGWAQKSSSPILSDLWGKIMGSPLEDKPQSILYKINLLFSMGIFPEITFDMVRWEQTTTVQDEFDRQMAFFKKLSQVPAEQLEKIIRDHLNLLAEGEFVLRQHEGLTATAIWKIPQDQRFREKDFGIKM